MCNMDVVITTEFGKYKLISGRIHGYINLSVLEFGHGWLKQLPTTCFYP